MSNGSYSMHDANDTVGFSTEVEIICRISETTNVTRKAVCLSDSVVESDSSISTMAGLKLPDGYLNVTSVCSGMLTLVYPFSHNSEF